MLSNNIVQLEDKTLEKVLTHNDLAGLTPKEKLSYMISTCRSLNLNPATKPFQLLKFQGREMLYATKDCTEQLRKLHNVSITSIDTSVIDGIYIVKANASLPCGRTDTSTGVITIKGLSGDNLANAMMKAETKAKRRVTLSICGLGMLDESETDTMNGNQKIDIDESLKEYDDFINVIKKNIIESIRNAKDMDDLKNIYSLSYQNYGRYRDEFSDITKEKDIRKSQLKNPVVEAEVFEDITQ